VSILDASGADDAGVAPRPLPIAGDTGADGPVTALYAEHALALIRLAYVLLGDKPGAEDVVHDAFCGLYRNWANVADPAKALPYLRASVLNRCRSAGRRRTLWARRAIHEPASASAETLVLAGEEQRSVLPAIRRLPARQREVLILRFYLDEPEAEISRLLGISPSTVRSCAHRALAALARILGEEQ
jgi:RNA polymerase sigma-70 factor (sigma-E family)